MENKYLITAKDLHTALLILTRALDGCSLLDNAGAYSLE